jgi:hypothetical protein
MPDPIDPTIKITPPQIAQNGFIRLEAENIKESDLQKHWYDWRVTHPVTKKDAGRLNVDDDQPWIAHWFSKSDVGPHDVTLKVRKRGAGGKPTGDVLATVTDALLVVPGAPSVSVSLARTQVPDTPQVPFWDYIRTSSDALSFANYTKFIDFVICGTPSRKDELDVSDDLQDAWEIEREKVKNATVVNKITKRQDYFPETRIPFPDVESYRILKAATEAFLMSNCGVFGLDIDFFSDVGPSIVDLAEQLGMDPGELDLLWRNFLTKIKTNGSPPIETLPYLAIVRQKLKDVPLTGINEDTRLAGEVCYAILRHKFTNPCLLELIWSYWHEEGMLVQAMNAIGMRFQNRRGPAELDPLAEMAIDPLRPLNNLLWGYIQDEQHRLTLGRRVYEYDHEYGLTLVGQAVPRVQGADTRSKFLEAFHNLLHRASIFYKEDDDTTMIADSFPVLNALREVHLLLAEGAHNQWGDLPWTARHEMLMQQWILGRQEFREFLPSRIMVPYPEAWMERVDAMRRLQGWGDTSVRYFSDLGRFGEQILLSVRFGNWSNIFDRNEAADWARSWRQEVQWYIHAYQTVTGVDLSADITDVREAEQAHARALQPAFHIQRRIVEQRTQVAPGRPRPDLRPRSPKPTAPDRIQT